MKFGNRKKSDKEDQIGQDRHDHINDKDLLNGSCELLLIISYPGTGPDTISRNSKLSKHGKIGDDRSRE